MERYDPEQTRESAPLGGLRELSELAVEFVGAAAQMVGRDVLHLLGIRDRNGGTYTHAPMTDKEVGDWNNEHGFPRDWRN